MKKMILIAVLALFGCDEEKAADIYTKRPTLMPEEVVALHKICKDQPNYDTSWVETRARGEAKGVICRFKDSEYTRGVSSMYRVDAAELKSKLGVKK